MPAEMPNFVDADASTTVTFDLLPGREPAPPLRPSKARWPFISDSNRRTGERPWQRRPFGEAKGAGNRGRNRVEGGKEPSRPRRRGWGGQRSGDGGAAGVEPPRSGLIQPEIH